MIGFKKTSVMVSVALFVLAVFGAAFSVAQVEPVNWRDIVPFLIEIQDWSALGDATGSSMNVGGFQSSQGERGHTLGDKTLTVQVVDGAFSPMIYAGIKMAMSMEIDTSEEFVRKVEVKNYPGVLRYNFETKEAELILLIVDRFLNNYKGENFTEEEAEGLKTIAEQHDLDGIAALNKK